MKKSHDEYPLKIMQIRAFCMIAERGMVSEAANNLFRTQSLTPVLFVILSTLYRHHYLSVMPAECC